mmetsp:Transcript_20732/g.44023  ORF Transcript_20732/g.44023 Transcript_20732/m.44023 type:complete len:204 (+) Transcript_20732:284-895(+)
MIPIPQGSRNARQRRTQEYLLPFECCHFARPTLDSSCALSHLPVLRCAARALAPHQKTFVSAAVSTDSPIRVLQASSISEVVGSHQAQRGAVPFSGLSTGRRDGGPRSSRRASLAWRAHASRELGARRPCDWSAACGTAARGSRAAPAPSRSAPCGREWRCPRGRRLLRTTRAPCPPSAAARGSSARAASSSSSAPCSGRSSG